MNAGMWIYTESRPWGGPLLNYRCFCCGSGMHLSNHHILARAEGGSDDRRNKVTLCSKCHDAVEGMEWKHILARRKAISSLREDFAVSEQVPHAEELEGKVRATSGPRPPFWERETPAEIAAYDHDFMENLRLGEERLERLRLADEKLENQRLAESQRIERIEVIRVIRERIRARKAGLPVSFSASAKVIAAPNTNMVPYSNPRTDKGWTDEEEAAFANIMLVARMGRIPAIQLFRRCNSDRARAIKVARSNYSFPSAHV